MATGAIIGGLLGAGGSIGGALLSSQGGSLGTSGIPATGFNPAANPLLAAASLGLLGQIGGPTTGVVQQSSPLARLQNLPGTGALGFSSRDQARLNNAIAFISPIIEAGARLGIPVEVIEQAATNFQATARRGDTPPTDEAGIVSLAANRRVPQSELQDAVDRGGLGGLRDFLRETQAQQRPLTSDDGNKRIQLVNRALSAGGFDSLTNLISSQQTFQQQATEQEEVQAGLQPTVLEGIRAAQERISELQQNFPIPTQDQIEDFRSRLVDRQAAEFLERANVAGINPSGGLGQIQNDPQTLANAVQLFGGIQGLGQQALSTLQQSLLGPLGAAVTAGGTQGQLQLGGAQLAADQARAMAQLQAQQGAAQNVSLGQGFAGAFQSAADVFGRLGEQRQQSELINALRGFGQRSATPNVLVGQEAGGFGGLSGLLGGRVQQ